MSSEPRERIHVVAAAPGYYVLWIPIDDIKELGHPPTSDDMSRDPIVAWKIRTSTTERGEESHSYPVGMCGAENYDEIYYALLTPDGQVHWPGEGLWKTIDGYLEHLAHEWREFHTL